MAGRSGEISLGIDMHTHRSLEEISRGVDVHDDPWWYTQRKSNEFPVSVTVVGS
jgi:hypothetical protein